MTLLLLSRFVLLAALAAAAAAAVWAGRASTMTATAAPATARLAPPIPDCMRDANEDRFHVDTARGLFMVIDGVGGQAAGGEAAALALSMLRARLERETGPVDQRVREAIAVANNEIHRAAASRPDWNGMACVLTVAVIKDGVATIGHVGDTRLYKIRAGPPRRRSRAITRRSASARTPGSCRNPKPCGIRGGTRCTATWARSSHDPGDTDFVGHPRGAGRRRRGAAALQRRPERPGARRHDCRGGGRSRPDTPSGLSSG